MFAQPLPDYSYSCNQDPPDQKPKQALNVIFTTWFTSLPSRRFSQLNPYQKSLVPYRAQSKNEVLRATVNFFGVTGALAWTTTRMAAKLESNTQQEAWHHRCSFTKPISQVMLAPWAIRRGSVSALVQQVFLFKFPAHQPYTISEFFLKYDVWTALSLPSSGVGIRNERTGKGEKRMTTLHFSKKNFGISPTKTQAYYSQQNVAQCKIRKRI